MTILYQVSQGNCTNMLPGNKVKGENMHSSYLVLTVRRLLIPIKKTSQL